ncbi:puromycin-sensitive aminopeptidase [Ixodes scapularis]
MLITLTGPHTHSSSRSSHSQVLAVLTLTQVLTVLTQVFTLITLTGHLETLLRSTVIGRLARFKDEAVLTEAKKRLEAHIAGTAIIPADIRSVVYQAAASTADRKLYDALLKLYRSTDLQEERNRIAAGLAAFTDPELIQATLEFALSSEVKTQDAVFVIISCAATPISRDMAWRFLQSNKGIICERFSGFLITRLVKQVTEDFVSEEMAVEVKASLTDIYYFLFGREFSPAKPVGQLKLQYYICS